MNNIVHILDDATIDKIAAGEIVERPASVVKELVENSIDAGASRIDIEIEGGGIEKIRVTDNGKGMSPSDAEMAMQRHATSKLRAASDLQSIATLGFRGEALPTIASVSRFSMLTREPDSDLGTSIVISGGHAPEISEAGCAVGTTICAEDLFFNVPARKKFLKTQKTEGMRIGDFVTRLALACPHIEFHLSSGGKRITETSGNGDLQDTIAAVYGRQAASSLLPVSFCSGEATIKGFISKPSLLKGSRNWQTLIVNGRVVQNPAVFKAIDNAYRSMRPKNGYPLAVLLIDVPRDSIDVNVHPQKAELKFEDESIVFKAVYKAVLDAVRPDKDGRTLQQFAATVEKPHMQHLAEQEALLFPSGSPSPAEVEHLADRNTVFPAKQDMALPLMQEADTCMLPAQPTEKITDASEDPEHSGIIEGRSLFPIGQVALTYIVAQDREGLYIVDQHAAHERILFDRLAASADKIPSQQLLVHEILSFDENEAELLTCHQELLATLGFSIEPAGDRDFRLTEIPVDVPLSEAGDSVREILAGIAGMKAPSHRDIREHVLATAACRAAIKAGQVLNKQQMAMLLDELMCTPFPYTCPHGRPTIIKFTSMDLAKMFKRTGFDLTA